MSGIELGLVLLYQCLDQLSAKPITEESEGKAIAPLKAISPALICSGVRVGAFSVEEGD